MIEEWKVWKETNGWSQRKRIYEVSNFGNVKINGELFEFNNNSPYYFTIAGMTIHRLVATMFIPNPENKPCVDHIDTNIHNNRADNLRWTTYKENNNNPITKKKQNDKKYGNKNAKGRIVTTQMRDNISKFVKGRVWINNGVESKMVYPYELDKYIGYVRGRC